MKPTFLAAIALLATSGCGGDATTLDAGVEPVDGAPPVGPGANAGPDREVIGGLVVPLDGSASSNAVTHAWEVLNGPDIAITDADQPIARVAIPADAAVGTAWVFRLVVEDGEGSTTEDSVGITVRDAVFENYLAAVTDPEQLGDTEGIAFIDDRMYVVSMGPPGWISTFDATGAFEERIDIGNRPVGANFAGDGRLIVADASDQSLLAFDPTTGAISTLAEALEDGTTPLGPANYPLPDRDGNIYLTNRVGGQILRYDATTMTVSVFAEDFGMNPNALAFGPEDDVLYAGTIEGVWRIPINSDGTAGTPMIYVDNIDSEVDGLAFDIGNNLYVGCPNSGELHIVPYVADGPSTPARSFQSVGNDVSLFTSVTFGRGAFGEDTLYWTNLSRRTVGRMTTGLPRLGFSLAP